tara:strand:+ start:192 stop:782 length:591 start_codon:yes stop_codon:yes gene_type:complete
MDVKTLCLGILSRGDATGYEIKKQCEEGPFAHFYAAGFGSIYPALNALCAEGHVSMREENQAGRPTRKIYTITASGRLRLTTALSQAPAPDRLRSDFLFTTFFGHLLPASLIDRVIDGRIAALRQELEKMRRCQQQYAAADIEDGEAFTLGYGIAVYQAAADYLESHRHELVGAALRSELGVGVDSRREPVLEDKR